MANDSAPGSEKREDGWYCVRWPHFKSSGVILPGPWRVAAYDAANDEWIDQGLHRRHPPLEIGPRVSMPDELPAAAPARDADTVAALRDICEQAGRAIIWPWPLEYHEAQSVVDYIDQQTQRILDLERQLGECRAKLHDWEHEPSGQLRAKLSNADIRSILDKAKEYMDERDNLRELLREIRQELFHLAVVPDDVRWKRLDVMMERIAAALSQPPEGMKEKEKNEGRI